MKRIIVLFILLLISSAFSAEEKILISIGGITSKDCINKIKTALENVDGVQSAEVKLESCDAIVTYDTDKTNGKNLLKAIAISGYKVHGVKTVPTTSASAGSSCSKVTKKEPCESKQNLKQYQDTNVTGHKQESHPCPSIKQCKELIEFHEAMHPMHIALSENDYETARECYPALVENSKALESMPCDDKSIKDTKAFKGKRTLLLKTVDELGKACQAKDDKKLTEAFDRMHEAYIELGKLVR